MLSCVSATTCFVTLRWRVMQSCKSARASGVAGLILLVFAIALYGHTIDVYVEPEACSAERALASARQNPLFVQNTFFASARAHPLN